MNEDTKVLSVEQDEPKKVTNEIGGLLKQEEILEILSGEVSLEEMISRWEKENGN